MKKFSLLALSILMAFGIFSCKKSKDNSPQLINTVNLDTVSVSGTSFQVKWDVQTTSMYSIEVYEASDLTTPVFEEFNIDNSQVPYTVEGLTVNTQYRVKITEINATNLDGSIVGEMDITTKASDSNTTGTAGLQISGLSVPDGGTLTKNNATGWSVSMAIEPMENWNSAFNTAYINVYLGTSKDNMTEIIRHKNWTMQMGSTNPIEFFTTDPAAGTYYWQIVAEFDIDGAASIKKSEIYSLIVN